MKDKELIELITDPANFEKYKEPVCAFVTFESDNAYNIATEYP